MPPVKMLIAALAAVVIPYTLAATGKNPGKPTIRTFDGKVLFDTGSGAILTLESSQPLSCPEQKTTTQGTTTAAPPAPPKKEAVKATVAADKVGWFEAAPELMPRYSEPGVDRYVYALGVGLGGKLFFNPRAKRQLQCKFDALGGSKSKLPTTNGHVVKSREELGEVFYDVACDVPEVSQPPAKYTLSILYKGEAIEFIGAKGNSDFELTSYFTKVSESKGLVTVTGAGLNAGGSYKCVFKYVGGSSADVQSTASVVDTTSVTCPATGIKSSTREVAVKVTLFDAALKAAVTLQQGSANQITVDTCADGAKNNAETDVDCGGGQCPGCGVQQACSKKADCDGQLELLCVDRKCIVPDKDGDGQTEKEGDCDDANPKVYKGAKELYDGLDNDCDGKGKDGDFDLNKINAGTQSEWEFTEFKFTSGTLRPMRAQKPFTVWSLKSALIGSGAKVFFDGSDGVASADAYTYRNVQGGSSGPGGGGNRGATGPGGCVNQNHPSFRGIGRGAGMGGQCSSYGPGGAGAGHQAKGAAGGKSPSHSSNTPGGNAYGSADKPELNPGSGGGGGAYGTYRNQGGSAGGGAGGTFRLVAPSIDVQGAITAKGGSGGAQGRNSGDGGTGGGGSGGTIWLESSDAKGTIKVTGTLDAGGGLGGRVFHRGGTGGKGADGRIWYNRDSADTSKMKSWKKQF